MVEKINTFLAGVVVLVMACGATLFVIQVVNIMLLIAGGN